MQNWITQLHRFRRGLRRAWMAVLCMTLMLCMASTACAIDPIDEARKTSMTVVFNADGKPATGMTFHLYRVADMKDFGTFTFCGDFANDSISADREIPSDMDSAEWNALAETLSSFVAADAGRKPIRTKLIGTDGTLTFSGLDVGLYLLLSKPYTVGNATYYTLPTLVVLPGRDGNDQWNYHVTVHPKPGKVEKPYIDIEVVKIWKDNQYANRPKSVTVDLVKDGRVIKTAVLSAANHWKYTWKNLPNDPGYKVIERNVPEGYTVKIYTEGDRVIVTNTRPGPKPPPVTTLPQTGQLWWPVPLLAGGGMVLFVIGWLRRRRYEEE